MSHVECANCEKLRAEFAAYVEHTKKQFELMASQLNEAKKRIKELEEKLGKNSRNSSLPPSANPPGAKKPVVKKPTGRKPGGQPGHSFHPPHRFPPGQLQDVVHHIPETCKGCGDSLPKEATEGLPEPDWHQVVEIPPSLIEVIEHQSHPRCCPNCHEITWGEIPGEITRHRFGPRLAALIGYLSGSPHVSKRGSEALLEQVFGLPVALGSISNLERELTEALADPYSEALAGVRQAAAKNVDESGWKMRGKKAWAWAMASVRHAAFQIGFNRGKPALQALLGGKPVGVFGSDRWWAYSLIPTWLRQLCWAHLKRDLRQIMEREGPGAWVGRKGLRYHRQVFELWHRFREGRFGRLELGRRMVSMQRRFGRLLRKGLACAERKTARFCANVLRFEEALWTFVRKEGVEPTNNHAERTIRTLVLWRKISFGCHSEKGFRFVERVLTVTQTLKLQGRPVFQFLCDAMTALRNGTTAPSLA